MDDLTENGQHDPCVLRVTDQAVDALGGQLALQAGVVDLNPAADQQHQTNDDEYSAQQHFQRGAEAAVAQQGGPEMSGIARQRKIDAQKPRQQIDRKSVVQGKSVSVRVDLGGRRILKKNTKT